MLINWQHVRDILVVAQPKNERLGITGILISHGMYFLQTLEGDRPAVVELFEQISHDDRHTDVQRLELEPITQRRFAGWSMRGFEFQQLSEDQQRLILQRHFNGVGEFRIPSTPADCLRLLQDIGQALLPT